MWWSKKEKEKLLRQIDELTKQAKKLVQIAERQAEALRQINAKAG
jgi:hypothetical protein